MTHFLIELKAVCAKDTKVMEGLCRKVLAWTKKRDAGCSSTSNGVEWWKSNVFGDIVHKCKTVGIVNDKDGKYRIGERHCYAWSRNGIEILYAKPNAKLTTYSRDCSITVSKLKEACKQNGVKGITKMDKKQLLHALMKC
jgi:hypothetical protein